MRFRQIHLDFHTSKNIDNVGAAFDKAKWQDTLKRAHIDSITLFSKCHHGLTYHPTKVGCQHPGLHGFNLLGAQYEAVKEIGVKAPIYINAGFDVYAAEHYPEWVQTSARQGETAMWKLMCFNSPYLDYLIRQTEEVVDMFPDCDGIFFDIIMQADCRCPHCLKLMEEAGLDPDNPEDMKRHRELTLRRYYEKLTPVAKRGNPDRPVFHNSGHVSKHERDIDKYFSHFEIESLPTGEWSYDHFPISAKFAGHLGKEYLGMTGKFNTTWGEFGGFKHPNALRYECAQMLAFGAKCSIGDQLHPCGALDETTYNIIGKVYGEVETKEEWCDNVKPVTQIAVLSRESESGLRDTDTGAGRVLFESHFLWDLVDRSADFDDYELVIFADDIRFDDELTAKVKAYLEKGGKVLLTGRSGLRKDSNEFAFDFGVRYVGENPLKPDYLLAKGALELDYVKSPLVMYYNAPIVRAERGEVLGDIYNPYFTRGASKWCSHQHTPYEPEETGLPAAVLNGNVLYLAHPIFSIYEDYGAVAYKEYAAKAVKLLLDEPMLATNLPSTAKASLMKQVEKNRYVLHLLYAIPVQRGANRKPVHDLYDDPFWPSRTIQVIEELPYLTDVEVKVKLPEDVKRIYLAPSMRELPVIKDGNYYKIKIDGFSCHEMIVFDF
ncbi:MAG: beta-galactosidase trimerization domain-containing protein [Abditibacteriota bacterium]|nr:beta-galactosidase trimerization domain-containing protein [Abditibacteriota bacterium]